MSKNVSNLSCFHNIHRIGNPLRHKSFLIRFFIAFVVFVVVMRVLQANVSTIKGAKVQIVVTCELHFYCNNLGICSFELLLLLQWFYLLCECLYFLFYYYFFLFTYILPLFNVSQQWSEDFFLFVFLAQIFMVWRTYLVKNILDSDINTCKRQNQNKVIKIIFISIQFSAIFFFFPLTIIALY